MQIGKYTITEDEKQFNITYRYTVSDFIGSFSYILMFLFGLAMLHAAYKSFTAGSFDGFSDWLVGLIGLGLFLFGTFFLTAGFYRFGKAIFSIDKLKKEVTLVDFLKSETILFEDIASIYHDIKIFNQPKMKYAILNIRLTNGTVKECFIVRSSIFFDLGRKIDKDLNKVARGLRDEIYKAISG